MSIDFHPVFAGPLIVAVALVLEAAFGYPDWLLRRVGHPVQWVGTLIAALDARLNRATMPEPLRRLNGVLALLIVLAAAILPAMGLQLTLFALLPWGFAILAAAALASALFAQRSLWVHIHAVADGLDRSLDEGRAAVAQVVGRDPQSLDEAGVARAAIESLAENFSDGVTAPAVWGLLGLPGLAAYKAVNTADSMIGHLTPRHRAFGWAAARLDDLLNLPASRLSVLWIVLAACLHAQADAGAAWRAAWRDARRHRSPNAGWPEAAMAGALGLRLAGPRVYHGEVVHDAWMGDGRADATAGDIALALTLYRTACGVQIAAFAALAAAILLIAPA